MRTITTNESCQIVTTNKQIVDSLLSLNTNNRPLKKTVVDAYKRDIIAGKWVLTNQGIGVSENGVLIDGQHRLEAIKQCDYPPVRILVVRGPSEDSRIGVDQHAKRSARDILQFAFNHRVSQNSPAICNVIYRETHSWGAGAVTINEMFDILQAFQSEIETVISVPKKEKYFAAPYLACFVMMMEAFPEHKEKIIEFMNQVESGEMLSKNMPAFHLRNLIFATNSSKGGGDVQKIRLRKAMRAALSHVQNEPLGILREFPGNFYKREKEPCDSLSGKPSPVA